jgi:transcriptional regulator with XRE-family HTH domain
MTLSPEVAEQRLMGQALRALRERADMSQGAAGQQADPTMSSQAWSKYEAGERKFPRDQVTRLTRALGCTPEDLAMERAKILGREPPPPPTSGFGEKGTDFILEVWGRARAGAAGPQVYDVGEPERYIDLRTMFTKTSRVTMVAGESVIPWANSGTFVVYNTNTWPRREDGCVIEMNSGELIVKIYMKTDGSNLYVDELFPERKTLVFPLSDVKGVYAVTLRGN